MRGGSFAPGPNPSKASENISDSRATMGSLQPHVPLLPALPAPCSLGLDSPSVLTELHERISQTTHKFCSPAHQETGLYWRRGFIVIPLAPCWYKAKVTVVQN